MAVDDEGARKARAEGLRRQIEELKKGRRTTDRSKDAPGDPAKPDYRTLIDKRMHELDKKDRT